MARGYRLCAGTRTGHGWCSGQPARPRSGLARACASPQRARQEAKHKPSGRDRRDRALLHSLSAAVTRAGRPPSRDDTLVRSPSRVIRLGCRALLCAPLLPRVGSSCPTRTDPAASPVPHTPPALPRPDDDLGGPASAQKAVIFSRLHTLSILATLSTTQSPPSRIQGACGGGGGKRGLAGGWSGGHALLAAAPAGRNGEWTRLQLGGVGGYCTYRQTDTVAMS
jgi:hypothetical protein